MPDVIQYTIPSMPARYLKLIQIGVSLAAVIFYILRLDFTTAQNGRGPQGDNPYAERGRGPPPGVGQGIPPGHLRQ